MNSDLQVTKARKNNKYNNKRTYIFRIRLKPKDNESKT